MMFARSAVAAVAQGGAWVAPSQPARIRTKSKRRTRLSAWAEGAKCKWKWQEKQGFQTLARKLFSLFRRINSTAAEIDQLWKWL